MGYLRGAAAVVVLAMMINRIPGFFQVDYKVPAVVGSVAPGWEHVRDVYRKLFEEDDDRGGSLCVYHKGKPVVDLRGGFANEKELWPWQENTITRLFSTSKGLGGLVMAVLVDRGFMKYEDQVVKYWPEFGAHGKENVTVEMLLSHQTGLVDMTDESFSFWDEVNDVEKLGRMLAAEKPLWEIGSGVGYHGVTIGLYMDQLVRRVDPKRRSLPQFFQEEIARPFELDLQFALKDSDVYRTATYTNLPVKLKYLPKMISLLARMFVYPKIFSDGVDYVKVAEKFDDKSFAPIWIRLRPDVNKLWNPSGFAYGNAKSLAKLFGIAANGGSFEGKKLMSPAMVNLQAEEVKSGYDKCLKTNMAYGRGYSILYSPKGSPMFGTPGLGGQIGYADPRFKLGIGFVSNYLSATGIKDHRYVQLEQAIYDSLDIL